MTATTLALNPALSLAVQVRLHQMGITQQTLVELLGVSPQWLAGRLTGRVLFDTADFDRVAAALGLEDGFALLSETMAEASASRLESLGPALAIEVRTAMRAAGLSLREVAQAAGIPYMTLSRRINSHGPTFYVHELAAIGEVLGVTVTGFAVRAEQALGLH